MRKTIRLSGRRQLPQSYFDAVITKSVHGYWVELAISPEWDRSSIPSNAELKLKLVENKLVEVLSFGTIAQPRTRARLNGQGFRAPSCQVRVVSREEDRKGLLLASTNSWTLKGQGDPDGILLFQAAPISPRLWKLEIRSDEHPILYIDEQIPNAALWAKSDPVFTACVLPQVASSILRSVLDSGERPEQGWDADWIEWARAFSPSANPPFGKDEEERATWVDDVVEAFSRTHDFLRIAIDSIEAKQQ
jgi:hypothetical protein